MTADSGNNAVYGGRSIDKGGDEIHGADVLSDQTGDHNLFGNEERPTARNGGTAMSRELSTEDFDTVGGLVLSPENRTLRPASPKRFA